MDRIGAMQASTLNARTRMASDVEDVVVLMTALSRVTPMVLVPTLAARS